MESQVNLIDSDDELACWLAFNELTGVGLGTKRAISIYERLQSMTAGWKASKSVLESVPGLPEDVIDKFIAKRNEIDPQLLLAQVKEAGIQAYPYNHSNYPSILREIPDPPIVLYTKGDFNADVCTKSIAIVGTRTPTSYGQKVAKEFARELSSLGISIISGMALGIDSCAHWGALEGGSATIAVLGCGPDHCYPPTNRPLYEQLTKGGKGAVVSEYFPGTLPDAWRFPARNRIIAGMARATLVVEAGEESGALITAEFVLEDGKDVYAIPGRIDNPMAKGVNKLIDTPSAQIVLSVPDFLQKLEWVKGKTSESKPTPVELYGREKEVYDLIAIEPMQFDVLIQKTGMPVGELSAILTMLELGGVVIRQPGDWYSVP